MDTTYELDIPYDVGDYSSLDLDYGITRSAELSSGETAVMAAFGIGIIIFALVVGVILYVISALLLANVFKKAGVPAWKAWVPFVNNWATLEMGGQKGFWAVLAIIPIVNFASLVFLIMAIHNINLKFKYGAGMTVAAIFVPLIWLIILASSKNTWEESLGAPRLDTPESQPPTAAGHQMAQPTAPIQQEPTAVAPPQPPMPPEQVPMPPQQPENTGYQPPANPEQ